jgi:hypothetical protein
LRFKSLGGILAVLALAAILLVKAQVLVGSDSPKPSASSTSASPEASAPRASSHDERPQSNAAESGQGKPAETAPEDKPAPTPKWFDWISLSGFLSGDGRWRRAGESAAASTTTDIYLRAFELGVEADIDSWLSATAVINSEYVGDTLLQADTPAPFVVVEEAHLDITVPHTPIYFVLGKRSQPFGLFESYLATDLMVQDLYETKAVGLTAGVKAPGSTDVSFTAYKGRVRAKHMALSGLFGPETPDIPEVDTPLANSWIVSGVSSPAGDDWRVSAALASEPGAGRRQTTVNLGSYLSLPFYEHLELNAEFMRALRRDDVPGLGRSFRETALTATLSYVLITPKMIETSGRNYRARRSRRFAHPAVAAFRFEALGDGGRADALGTWSVKHRISAGGRYTFYTRGTVEAAMTLEYRRQTIRVSPVFAGPVPEAHEVYLRFGLDF